MKCKKEDLNLIKKAVKGNPKSFSQLYEKYHRAIRGFIASRCPNDEDVNDLEQDIWIHINKKLDRYDPEKGAFYTFVKKSAHFKILDYYETLYINEELEDNTPAVEGHNAEKEEREEVYRTFLSLTFSKGGPPHQLIAFGFNKLLKKGPKKLVAKHTDVLLTKLSEVLILSYIEQSFIPENKVRECFQTLRIQMDKRVREVLEKHDSLEKYQKIMDKKVGNTCLKDYYGKNPEHNIADWSNKVKNRLLKLAREYLKISGRR